MKLVRFIDVDGPSYGRVDNGLVSPTSLGLPALHSALQAGEDPFHARTLSLDALELVLPSLPTKVVCIGLNYRHHAEEMGKKIPAEPLFFLKPTTALLAHGKTIRLPLQSELVHFEGELAVIIGSPLCDATPEEVKEAIFGATCLNDVTARDIQRREKRYTRGKGFDTFAPCGPFIETSPDLQDLQLTTRVNGVIKQTSSTNDMIFEVLDALAFISTVMTLLPGDIVATGTPSGVGPLVAGDRVSVEIGGIGVLENVVALRETRVS